MSDANMGAVVERIQKILALGRRGGTEAEATTAMAKAQQALREEVEERQMMEDAAEEMGL